MQSMQVRHIWMPQGLERFFQRYYTAAKLSVLLPDWLQCHFLLFVHLFLAGAAIAVVCCVSLWYLYASCMKLPPKLKKSSHFPFFSQFHRRTRTIFHVALKVHLNIQQRDIEVVRNLVTGFWGGWTKWNLLLRFVVPRLRNPQMMLAQMRMLQTR